MTVPPTEASPSKRSTARTMSSPRAAREPRSTKGTSRTTIRAERRGSRSQSSYSFVLLSLSSHHACIAARSAARRSTSYRHAARRCCGRDGATSERRDWPPPSHVHQQLACQGPLATKVGTRTAGGCAPRS